MMSGCTHATKIAGMTRQNSSARWAEWVQQHLDALGWTNIDLARAAGIDRSLIGRWLNDGTRPTIESIRAVCRAFHRDIRQGLIMAGLFTEAEMQTSAPAAPDVRLLGDEELLGEVRRRMRRSWASDQDPEEDTISGSEQSGEDVTEIEIDDPTLARTATAD